MNSYKNFSYYYDEIMEIIEYDEWVNFIKPLLKKDDTILDLACGTGTLAISLANLGYKVFGLDLSDEAINVAKEKAKINHVDIDFKVLDMSDFKYENQFDVITCFFDSVNFLTLEQIPLMMDSVYQNLKDGGYFIFDLFTHNKMKFFNNTTIKDKLSFAKYKWKMKVKDNILIHKIEINDNKEIVKEEYKEYFYNYEDIIDPRFKIISVTTDFTNELDLKNGERILVVLRK